MQRKDGRRDNIGIDVGEGRRERMRLSQEMWSGAYRE